MTLSTCVLKACVAPFLFVSSLVEVKPWMGGSGLPVRPTGPTLSVISLFLYKACIVLTIYLTDAES